MQRQSRGAYPILNLAQFEFDAFGRLAGQRAVRLVKDSLIGGQRIAQFVALEIKAPQGVVSPEQQAFLRLVQQLGGVAAVCRSIQQAQAVLGLVSEDREAA